MSVSCDVDVVTGVVSQDVRDLDLPSPPELALDRRYMSDNSQCGLLGFGWSHNFTPMISLQAEELVILDPIDGDRHFRLEMCDGTAGPRIFRGIAPELARDLRRPAKMNDFLTVVYSDCLRQVYERTDEDPRRWRLIRRAGPGSHALAYYYAGSALEAVALGRKARIEFAYQSDGLLRAVAVYGPSRSARRLVELQYSYDFNQQLVQFVAAHGAAWHYEYTDRLLVKSIDYLGTARHYAYDAHRECIASWSDGGVFARNIRRDPLRKTVVVTDSFGVGSIYRFNEAGAITAFVDARGQTTEYIVDATGGLLGVIEADGTNSEMYMEDSSARALTVMDSGDVRQIRLDHGGRMVSTTGGAGRTRRHGYDECGRLIQVDFEDQSVARYKYDEKGDLGSVVDQLGWEIRRAASDDGRHVHVFDEHGALSEQDYDALDNLVTDTDPHGRSTTFTYHAPELPSTETDAVGNTTTYTYDPALNVLSITDPLGRTERFEYDAFGELAAETDPMGGRIEYEYTSEGELSRITNQAGDVLTIEYDERGEQVLFRSFDGLTEASEIDALGRPTAVLDSGGHQFRFTYGPTGDVAVRLLPDGSKEEYAMSPEGFVSGISATRPPNIDQPATFVKYEYNGRGNVSRLDLPGWELTYERDAAGNLVGIADSFGDATRFIRGPRHRVQRIVGLNLELGLTYSDAGFVSSILYPNGQTQAFEYDAMGRMTARQMIGPAGRSTERRMVYDRIGQLVGMTDSTWGQFNYRYDRCGRLMAVEASDERFTEHFNYDTRWNLLESATFANAIYGPGNRLNQTDRHEFKYDARGNVRHQRVADQNFEYQWDSENQLIAASADGALVAEYDYDVLNQRTRKRTPEGETAFFYEHWTLRAERLPDGSLRRYLSLPILPVPLAYQHGGRTFFYGFDQIGTPTDLFDENGDLVLSIHSRAYGGGRQEVRTAPTAAIPFGFMGQYFDTETDLFYNYFRYYNPELGRFWSQDPLRLCVGPNFYIYPTNPNNAIDPNGLVGVATFKCPSHWGACQQWYARKKVAKMNRYMRNNTMKRCRTTGCREGYQAADYRSKRCGGGDFDGTTHAIDHLQDVQASGPDRCCNNLYSIDKDFNNELNNAVGDMFTAAGIPKPGPGMAGNALGAVGDHIKTEGCSTKGKCSKRGKRRTAKPAGGARNCPAAMNHPVANC